MLKGRNSNNSNNSNNMKSIAIALFALLTRIRIPNHKNKMRNKSKIQPKLNQEREENGRTRDVNVARTAGND